jgi:serine/threonine protein kinase
MRESFPSFSGHQTGARYRPILKIASGGMGAVYVGFHTGAAGFHRPVAIKRAHPHLLEDQEFRDMLVTESRLASLVRHPNVAGVCDVEEVNGELLLILDYIEGASLFELMNGPTPLPPALALRIVLDVCQGLAALHSATDAKGNRLGLVHRDVSPHNILVGLDGVARITDFGIAKAVEAAVSMTNGLRGKPGYMAPEYIKTRVATCAADIFGLGVVAWEAISRKRLFKVASDLETLDRVCNATIPPPSSAEDELPPEIEAVILQAIARSPQERHATTADFATKLELALYKTSLMTRHAVVGEFVRHLVGDKLEERRRLLACELPPVRDSQNTLESFDLSVKIETTKSMELPVSGGTIRTSRRRMKRTVTAALGAMTLVVAALGVQRGLLVPHVDPTALASAPPAAVPTGLPSPVPAEAVDLPPPAAAAAPPPSSASASPPEPPKPSVSATPARAPAPTPTLQPSNAPKRGLSAPSRAPANPYQ